LFLEHPNFEPANPMSTPDHIAPTWYFTPYYAILRAIPDQRLGALAFACSVLAFVFLPWLDRAKNKSIRYRGLASKLLLGMFFVVFLVLMWLGLQPAEPLYVLMARICIPLYFAFFILLPFVSKADGNGPVPERVTYHAH
jgi:ubiquinol-cytochrome c reductase cytochrome b subunit